MHQDLITLIVGFASIYRVKLGLNKLIVSTLKRGKFLEDIISSVLSESSAKVTEGFFQYFVKCSANSTSLPP